MPQSGCTNGTKGVTAVLQGRQAAQTASTSSLQQGALDKENGGPRDPRLGGNLTFPSDPAAQQLAAGAQIQRQVPAAASST